MTDDEVIGKRIGSHILMEKLGSGGFGHVYKARHVTLMNRLVALKIFKETEDREVFVREARLLDQLRHQAILSVTDVGIHREPFGRELPYMVTEYAAGGTLRDLLKERAGPLDFDEIMSIVTRIGEGLDYAHQKGIVHRDLKPENILFKETGEAVLADFGIAIILSSGSRSSDYLGTAAYMAPEQFDGVTSPKSDQYALACIVYELVTGQALFAEYKGSALAYQHVHTPPPLPRLFNPDLSQEREKVILKALAKEREDRYPDVLAFIAALKTPPRRKRPVRRERTIFEEPPSREMVHDWEEEPIGGGFDPEWERGVFPVVEPPPVPVTQRARRQVPFERRQSWSDSLVPRVRQTLGSVRRYHLGIRRKRDDGEGRGLEDALYEDSAPPRARRQSWSDSLVPRVRQTSRSAREPEPNDEEDRLRRRPVSSARIRGTRLSEDWHVGSRKSQVGSLQQPVLRKKWVKILWEPVCVFVLLWIAWNMPDAVPLSTLLLLAFLGILICLHSFFLEASDPQNHPRWHIAAWLTEVCFCFWGMFLIFVHVLGGAFVWFAWTILISSFVASIYWWQYPSRGSDRSRSV